MKDLITRDFKAEDSAPLARMIKKTWKLENYNSPEMAEKLARSYFELCMSEQTFSKIAEIDGKTIGIIACRDLKSYKKTLKQKISLILSNLYLFFSKEGRDILDYMKHLDNMDESLISQEAAAEYGAEIPLFIVDEEYRGLGAGKKLFEEAVKYMREKNIKKYYLFTDTQCDYEFYDHLGLVRANEKEGSYVIKGWTENLTHFLYVGEILYAGETEEQ